MSDLSPKRLRKLSQQFRKAGRKAFDPFIKRLFAEEALCLALEAEAADRREHDPRAVREKIS
jgi:hypothetical protein